MTLLFLFDIDGTLLRAGTEVHRAAFGHAYREVFDLSLSLDGVTAAGRTDTWLLAETLRRNGVSVERIARDMPRAFAAMEQYVDRNLGDLAHCVLPGVPRVLEGLQRRGAELGLITGNLRGIAHAKMTKAGLAQYFSVGGYGEESEVRADLVHVALRKASERRSGPIDPRETAVVGDTPLDIEAGLLCSVRTVGVATGASSSQDLASAGADLVLPSFEKADQACQALMHVFQ